MRLDAIFVHLHSACKRSCTLHSQLWKWFTVRFKNILCSTDHYFLIWNNPPWRLSLCHVFLSNSERKLRWLIQILYRSYNELRFVPTNNFKKDRTQGLQSHMSIKHVKYFMMQITFGWHVNVTDKHRVWASFVEGIYQRTISYSYR